MSLSPQDIGAALLAAPKNRSADLDASTLSTLLGLGTAAKLALAYPFVKRALVAGAVAGNVTVTGIKTTDQLAAVLRFIGAGTAVTDVTDLTAQFTVTATNTINNTSGTSSSGDKLLVVWVATS